MNEEKYILNNLILLLKNKKENELFVLNNKKICAVAIPYGTYGDIKDKNRSRGGYGLEHIIQCRYEKDKLNYIQISYMLIAICETIKYGDITRISNYKCVLTYKSIEAILARDYRYSTENWLLTGFAIIPQKKKPQILYHRLAIDINVTTNSLVSEIM